MVIMSLWGLALESMSAVAALYSDRKRLRYLRDQKSEPKLPSSYPLLVFLFARSVTATYEACVCAQQIVPAFALVEAEEVVNETKAHQANPRASLALVHIPYYEHMEISDQLEEKQTLQTERAEGLLQEELQLGASSFLLALCFQILDQPTKIKYDSLMCL